MPTHRLTTTRSLATWPQRRSTKTLCRRCELPLWRGSLRQMTAQCSDREYLRPSLSMESRSLALAESASRTSNLFILTSLLLWDLPRHPSTRRSLNLRGLSSSIPWKKTFWTQTICQKSDSWCILLRPKWLRKILWIQLTRLSSSNTQSSTWWSW